MDTRVVNIKFETDLDGSILAGTIDEESVFIMETGDDKEVIAAKLMELLDNQLNDDVFCPMGWNGITLDQIDFVYTDMNGKPLVDETNPVQ